MRQIGQQCRAEADELVAFLRSSDMNVAPFVAEPAVLPVRDDLPTALWLVVE